MCLLRNLVISFLVTLFGSGCRTTGESDSQAYDTQFLPEQDKDNLEFLLEGVENDLQGIQDNLAATRSLTYSRMSGMLDTIQNQAQKLHTSLQNLNSILNQDNYGRVAEVDRGEILGFLQELIRPFGLIQMWRQAIAGFQQQIGLENPSDNTIGLPQNIVNRFSAIREKIREFDRYLRDLSIVNRTQGIYQIVSSTAANFWCTKTNTPGCRWTRQEELDQFHIDGVPRNGGGANAMIYWTIEVDLRENPELRGKTLGVYTKWRPWGGPTAAYQHYQFWNSRRPQLHRNRVVNQVVGERRLDANQLETLMTHVDSKGERWVPLTIIRLPNSNAIYPITVGTHNWIYRSRGHVIGGTVLFETLESN